MYFIELDGMSDAMRRERATTVLAYNEERVIERMRVSIPVSKHPVDSVNLADPRLGLISQVNDLLARTGLSRGRVDLVIDPVERNVGLTVNEYETLLMQNDLMDVLRDPLRFAKLKARHALQDPLAVPGKTLNYAKFDAVRVLNSLMEALHLDQSSFERLVAKVMAVPARRFLRARAASVFSRRPIMNRGPAWFAGRIKVPSWSSGSPRKVSSDTSKSSSSRCPRAGAAGVVSLA